MWQRERRDAQRSRDGNGGDRERRVDGTHFSVAKNVSGKASVYMTWLSNIGSKRFFAINNYRYEQNDPEHHAQMDEWYQDFKNNEAHRETYKEYEEKVAAHNRDKTLVMKTKHAKARHNRQVRHSRPEEFERVRTEHWRSLEEGKGNNTIEISRDVEQIFHDVDIEAFCTRKTDSLRSTMSAILRVDRRPDENPLIRNSQVAYLVSIMPYSCKLKDNKDFSCYPAEITITTFNTMQGIIRNESRLLSMDAPWFYDRDEIPDIKDERSFYTNLSGLDERNSPAGSQYPCDVYKWLFEYVEREPNAKILFDRKHFTFVYYGLYCFSLYSGHSAKKFFNQEICNRLMTIQNYTSVLLSVSPLNKATRSTDEEINAQFMQNNFLPRQDLNLYCEHHESDHIKIKCYCTKALNALTLHHYFRLLKNNRVQGFIYSPVHELCNPVSETFLPPILVAPEYIREPVTPSLEVQPYNPSAQNHTIPLGGYDDDTDEDEEEDESDDDDPGFGVNQSGARPSNIFRQPAVNAQFITRAMDPRLVSVSTFNPTRPSPRSHDLHSPPRSADRGRNENYPRDLDPRFNVGAPNHYDSRRDHGEPIYEEVRQYHDQTRGNVPRSAPRFDGPFYVEPEHHREHDYRQDFGRQRRYGREQDFSREQDFRRDQDYRHEPASGREQNYRRDQDFGHEQDYSREQAFSREQGYHHEQDLADGHFDSQPLRDLTHNRLREIPNPQFDQANQEAELENQDEVEWENPVLLEVKSQVESEWYIKMATKTRTKGFKGYNFD